MSLNTRRELTQVTKARYHKATTTQKSSLLDEFTAATGYHRKYAVTLLNEPIVASPRTKHDKPPVKRRRIYDATVEKSLVKIWQFSNRLCSKRLVPFLPEFLQTLEACQEITVETAVRDKLRTLSVATCDRLLAPHRRSHGKATTKPGTLLKHQIPIRTYADWQEVVKTPF